MIRATLFGLTLMMASASFALSAGQKLDLDLSGDNHPATGAPNAAITMIEFSDFECPNCRRLEPTLIELRKSYGDRIRFVWMDFPLPSHRHALTAAVAARCAREQNQFWPYHDALMSGRESLGEGNLTDLADRLGLDPGNFRLCLAQRKYQGVVESDIDAGDAIGLSGTPSLVINGSLYNGNFSAADLKAAIDTASVSKATQGDVNGHQH